MMTIEQTETPNAIEYALGPVSQIPPGEGREFSIGGILIAVFRARNGEVYATQAVCPHRNGPLADGLLGGSTLVCPFHAWKFDLTTGNPLLGDCAIAVYPVRLSERGADFCHREPGTFDDLTFHKATVNEKVKIEAAARRLPVVRRFSISPQNGLAICCVGNRFLFGR